jgi:peptidoglycan/xylan/chitin deacetylase (PgdA/CDA1 family)
MCLGRCSDTKEVSIIDRLIVQPPESVRRLYSHSAWRLGGEKTMYLTFDDGPIEEQTPWVLDMLDKHGAKATFFCVGENVDRHREIYHETLRRGHVVGNHTYNHVQLLKVGWKAYRENIEKCSIAGEGKMRFFRPPHGQMTPWRTGAIVGGGLERVVFWDVMPEDYDRRLKPEEVYWNVRENVREGSIVVLHDSIKSGERMRYTLERILEEYGEKGWKFESIG